ncbi:thrombospondin-type laminin G domain and EAR repeat-containing protein [Gadus macrocephalus]|uniref:thrombospondin-type laminin G domain and EAR repeat-containing protein n=1 Tax=Gadus macrocephalus TaxID=80720 RepID=UPI0028CBBBD7|nr:thrombospondin-type laminin G domain and EAR repeat-containing protein [Gadus macrocephalus]XP_059908631.1 thrombospondin-type laminin G domain and EAR repeat-containing protein [Gadus macrocephalus]
MMSPMIFLLLLILRLTTTGTSAQTWRHCTDLPPLDLLSFVLEKDTSRPTPGVRVMEDGGMRGVRFSRPHPSLSFPSAQLLVNCDLFPVDFSIVVTLKVSPADLKRNEYIFSLLEENDDDNRTVRGRMMEDTEEDKTRGQTAGRREEAAAAAARKQQEEKGDEASGATARQRGAVILGLKIAGSRLHLVFQGHAKATENWVFRGVELTESQWHTLVLVVTGQRATLSVDCNAPVDMGLSRSFPTDLDIKGSTFHLGSRGRWKGLFSGLVRQLVLVPGSDATPQVCPSSEPGRINTLSVPPVLFDLSVKAQKTDSHPPSYEAQLKVSIGPQNSCSETLRGQLWFNPNRKGLYLCDGATWIPLLEEHKRLDYVVERQVLTTSSETYDIEVFQMPGMGLMAAMAHRSTSSGSGVYLWSQSGFQLYQSISTYGALSWRYFTLGEKAFLVVSNSGGWSQELAEEEAKEEFSIIYKWSKKRKRFVTYQTLRTHCARDWEAFSINGHTYLAVANHRQPNNNHTIESMLYRWNRRSKSFEVYQRLQTSGAYDWEFFTVGPYHFLVVANAFDGVTTHVDSVIYVWLSGSFQVFQTIKTFCATDWEMFQIDGRVFLVVANGHRLHGSGPSEYAINSTIYELDLSARLFVRFQDIITYSAVDWEFFSLGEDYFLVVANSFDGDSYSLNSVLYRWQGYEGFVPVHWLPTIGCSDWEFFTYEEKSYLIYSSAKAPLSKVFMLKTH